MSAYDGIEFVYDRLDQQRRDAGRLTDALRGFICTGDRTLRRPVYPLDSIFQIRERRRGSHLIVKSVMPFANARPNNRSPNS